MVGASSGRRRSGGFIVRRTRTTVILMIAACLVAGTSLLATPSITSRWKDKDREIKIDGLINDWTELIAFDENLAVAAFNDDRSLYLAITTSEPHRLRQLVVDGLIVWLDPSGGKKEAHGIRIPGAGFQPATWEGRQGGTPDLGAQQPREPALPELTYVELLGPGKDDRRRLELSGDTGIAAAAKIETGTLLYELKIPLGNAPYGVAVNPPKSLSLGLQTPKRERTERGQRTGRGMGGMGGQGGMGGGRRGGGGARGPAQQLQELKLWTTLALAPPPR